MISLLLMASFSKWFSNHNSLFTNQFHVVFFCRFFQRITIVVELRHCTMRWKFDEIFPFAVSLSIVFNLEINKKYLKNFTIFFRLIYFRVHFQSKLFLQGRFCIKVMDFGTEKNGRTVFFNCVLCYITLVWILTGFFVLFTCFNKRIA